MPRLTRIAMVGACILVALPAAATGDPKRAAACAPLVRYQGKLYEGTFVGKSQRRGASVHAVRPGCDDTPGANEPDAGVTVAQIVGISPSLALLASDNARLVYLVAGVFPEYPDHPLHVALYGNRARPNDCAGARTLGPVRVRGTLIETPLAFSLLAVRIGARRTSLLHVDAWSRLAYPYTRPLVKGNRVDIVAIRCRRPNTTGAIVVARRISRR